MWQKKRLEILNRDEWKCRRCTDQFTNLQVHHLYYKHDYLPWEYENEAFITLCELCHLKTEFIKWILNPVLFQKDGFLQRDITEIQDVITRRLSANYHRESAQRYMHNIKALLNG